MADEKPTLTETALRVAERFGVPVVLLCLLLWMAREAAVGLHTTVVVPVVESHTEFLKQTGQTLKEISATQHQQAEAMDEIVTGQREIIKAVTKEGS